MKKPYHVFVSTAEVSGDEHGAAVISALQKVFPKKIIFSALGGPKIAKTGARIVNDLTTQSSIGLIEGIRYIKKSFGVLSEIKHFLLEEKVDCVLCIDGQGRNLTIGKLAHRLKIKTAYYFPPPVFIWGKWNISRMKYFDLLLCPFKENAKVLGKHHPWVVYTGHPFSLIPKQHDKQKARKPFKLKTGQKLIALFPGSRYQEVKSLMPVFLETCKLLKKSQSKLAFALSLSHLDFEAYIKNSIQKSRLKIPVHYEKSGELLKAADFLITASGTATLQAAFYRIPTVICYKISALSFWIAKRLVYHPFAGMPNILAGKMLFKELINRDLTTQSLSQNVLYYLERPTAIKALQKDITQLIERVRVKDPYRLISKSVMQLLRR